MRYPPLLIALFLVMLLKPFTEHFRSFDLPGGLLRLIVFLTLIYAFRRALPFAICLTVPTTLVLTSTNPTSPMPTRCSEAAANFFAAISMPLQHRSSPAPIS